MLLQKKEVRNSLWSSLFFSVVGMTGFEPATTRPPDVYSTGLSYIPRMQVQK